MKENTVLFLKFFQNVQIQGVSEAVRFMSFKQKHLSFIPKVNMKNPIVKEHTCHANTEEVVTS